MQNNKSTFSGVLILLFTSLIWGFAFVAQRAGVNHLDSISLSELRYCIATGFLGLTVLLCDFIKRKMGKKVIPFNRDTVIGGLICGVVLLVSTLVQQIGIAQTTSAKAGFITALYIVIVPVFGVIARRRTSMTQMFAVVLALFGFVLLCITDNFTMADGDFLVLLSAFTFAFHILFIDIYCKDCDPVKFSLIQFAVCAVIGLPIMAANGFPAPQEIENAIIPLLYVGILSSGVAYTTQIAGQKRVHSSIATLIMSLESIIALLGGVAILGEPITAKELGGCLVVFVAVFLAQIEIPHTFLKLKKHKFFVE